MSLVLTMTSLAVLAGLTITEVSVTAVVESVMGSKKAKKKVNEGLETIFTDSNILYKTLQQYDCHITVVSENEYLVESENGKLRYYRKNENMPFSLFLDQIDDPDGLLNNISEFEKDYGRNIQDYTYHHIRDNLSNGMSICDEQVLDDELVLTINIE